MKKYINSIMAILMAIMLVVGMMPASAFADGDPNLPGGNGQSGNQDPPEPQPHTITVQVSGGHGNVWAVSSHIFSDPNEVVITSATEGTTVYPHVVPDNGYSYDTVTYTYMDGTEEKTISLINPMYIGLNSFSMPAADVTITATFKEAYYRLVNLSVNPGELSPYFDSGIFEYNVTVPADTDAIQAAVMYPEGGDISGSGWTLVSDDTANKTRTMSHRLTYGVNRLELYVYGAAGSPGTYYYLNVRRPPVPIINFASVTSTYDGNENTLSVLNESAFSADWNPAYQWYKDGTAIEGATESSYRVKDVSDSGKYKVSVTFTALDEPVTITSEESTVTINKKALTVTPSAQTLTFGEALDTSAYTVSGFAEGESEESLVAAGKYTKGKLTADYDPDNDEEDQTGTRAFGIDGFEADNYSFVCAGANLTVTPKDATSASEVTAELADTTAVYYYNGEEHKPEVVVMDGDAAIHPNNYNIVYENNINVSTENNPAKITIQFIGNYTGEKELTFEIRKIPTRIDIDVIGDAVVNEELTIEATLTDKWGSPLKGGDVLIFVNDILIGGVPKTDDEGKTSIKYTPRNSGSFTMQACYMPYPTDIYDVSKTARFKKEVASSLSVITLAVEDCIFGEDAFINGYLKDAQGQPIVDAIIELFINDEPVETESPIKTDHNGVYIYTIKTPDVGAYEVKAIFNGESGAFLFNTTTTKFTVHKIKTLLDVELEGDRSSTLTIKARRTAGATGGITVWVDGEEHIVEAFTVGEEYDLFTLTLENMTPGQHVVRAYYAGDERYTEANPMQYLVEIGYTVRFNPNPPEGTSETGYMNDQYRLNDANQPLTKCDYEIEDPDDPDDSSRQFIFTGWNTNRDGSGDAFCDEDTQNIIIQNGTGITLYAMWNHPQITTNRLSAGAEQTEYSATLRQVGLTNATWNITGDLPKGLTLDGDTGVISGAPTEVGTFTFDAVVTGIDMDGDQNTILKTLTLIVEHVWEDDFTIDIEPTCTEEGSKSIHCKHCDAVKDVTTIEAHGHDMGEWITITKPNCTENGSEEQVCSICKHKEIRDIAPNGHEWESDFTVDKQPTYMEEGSKSIHCKHCDEVTDVTAIEMLDKGIYANTEGAGGEWAKGSTGTLTFVFKRSENDEETFEHFIGIKVHGEAVPEKNAFGKANWTAKSGSVIIDLQPSYLETLDVGEHALTAEFDDGDAVSVKFSIKDKLPEEDPIEDPTKDPTEDPTDPTDDPEDPAEDPTQNPEEDPEQNPEEESESEANENSEQGNQGNNEEHEKSAEEGSKSSENANTTNTSKASPNTGDENNILIWISMLCASILAIAYSIRQNITRQSEEKRGGII